MYGGSCHPRQSALSILRSAPVRRLRTDRLPESMYPYCSFMFDVGYKMETVLVRLSGINVINCFRKDLIYFLKAVLVIFIQE